METDLARPMTTVDSIRKVLYAKPLDELIKGLPADRRALYEGIMKSREETGPIDFNIVEVLREIRGDG